MTLFLCAGAKSAHAQYRSECAHLLCVPLTFVKQVTEGNGTGKLALKSDKISLFLVGVTDRCGQLQSDKQQASETLLREKTAT